MGIHEFQKLLEKIPPFLNEKEKEEKIIQISDLKRFTECYDSNIKIIDCINSKVNIVEINKERLGILFYEFKKIIDPLVFYETFYDISHSGKSDNKELWFVFVEENSITNSGQFIDFIQEHKLSPLFDKIFLFQFSQAVIHQLK